MPPVFEPITPIKVSERWFPKGRRFGLYESGGLVAPNVTSILGWKFPFDKAKWKSRLILITTQSLENPPNVERQSTWQWRSG